MRRLLVRLFPILLAVVLAGPAQVLAQQPTAPPPRMSPPPPLDDEQLDRALHASCRTADVIAMIDYFTKVVAYDENQIETGETAATDALVRGDKSMADTLTRVVNEFRNERLPRDQRRLAVLKKKPPCLPPLRRVAHRTTTCDNPDCRYWANQYNEAADNYALARGAGPPEAAARYREQMREFGEKLDKCERRCRAATLTIPGPAPTPATPPTPSPTPPPPRPPGAMMPLAPGVQLYAGVTGGGATG